MLASLPNVRYKAFLEVNKPAHIWIVTKKI